MNSFDVVILGSGLAGLTAALHTQSAGLRTLVLERRATPGGLCGTFMQGGDEFVLGCNDFGDGLRRELESLGVDVQFTHPKALFYFGRRPIQLPPDLRAAMTLLPRLVELVRVFRAAKKSPQLSIGALIDQHIKDPLLADMACILVYGMMRSPDDISVSMISEVFAKELAYGYDKSSVPVGGPGRLIERMLQRYQELGGELWLSCEGRELEVVGSQKKLMTTRGSVLCRELISSAGRWSDYPKESKPGLEVSMMLFSLNRRFAYPRGVHTIGYFAPGAPRFLRMLDAGQWALGSFHLFCSRLPTASGGYTVNAVIPMPRGLRSPSEAQRIALQSYLEGALSWMLPGFREAIEHQYFLSPAEYEERFQLKSAPSPLVSPLSFAKPPSYRSDDGVHYIGTSVHPPGEHAGAASLSGKLAARAVIDALRKGRKRW